MGEGEGEEAFQLPVPLPLPSHEVSLLLFMKFCILAINKWNGCICWQKKLKGRVQKNPFVYIGHFSGRRFRPGTVLYCIALWDFFLGSNRFSYWQLQGFRVNRSRIRPPKMPHSAIQNNFHPVSLATLKMATWSCGHIFKLYKDVSVLCLFN